MFESTMLEETVTETTESTRGRGVRRMLLAGLVGATFLLASCGDDGDSSTDASASADSGTADSSAEDSSAPDDSAPEDSAPDDSAPDDSADALDDVGEDFVSDMVDDLEETQAAQGGGSATLTVGDQTWNFDSVLCAFGEDEIGQEGAEFVLSSLQDGLQMYASIDSFGHSISLNDIEDFENPSVSLSSMFGSDDFIVVDGKSVQADVGVVDDNGDGFTETPASFSATCP